MKIEIFHRNQNTEPAITPVLSTPDTHRSSRRSSGRKAGVGAGLVGGVLIGATLLGGGIVLDRTVLSNDHSSSAVQPATPGTSAAAGQSPDAYASALAALQALANGSKSPDASASAAASAKPEASASASSEWANPIRIESAQTAATRFGADAYSSNPSNWEINEYGGAHLKDNPQGKASKINTAGAVVEGWIKAKMLGARDALTFVANSDVPIVELNGGTVWDFGTNNEAGFAQVLAQVQAKEKVEQPDVTIIPLCSELQPINTVDVPLVKISSAQEAASMFGADAYSRNPSNWEINEYGGAHLKDNPQGEASLVNLDGTVLEGWIKAPRVNGRSAITFVGHPNVNQMRIDGGTFWEFTDANRGFQQLRGQVEAKEKVEQPDVTVLPAYNCAVK
jgi:hypothetical protein